MTPVPQEAASTADGFVNEGRLMPTAAPVQDEGEEGRFPVVCLRGAGDDREEGILLLLPMVCRRERGMSVDFPSGFLAKETGIIAAIGAF